MAKVTLDAKWGYRPLRSEKPRMGVRGSLGVDGWGMIGLLLYPSRLRNDLTRIVQILVVGHRMG